jgi:CheY-like chemotaxis protein
MNAPVRSPSDGPGLFCFFLGGRSCQYRETAATALPDWRDGIDAEIDIDGIARSGRREAPIRPLLEAQAMAQALKKPALCSGLRLLVVEDEIMISSLVEDMLAELGHRVVGMATSVEEAASLADRDDFDVALLDLNLQGETVEAIAATLVRRGKPFVFTTGYGDRAIPPAFKDRPMLAKPYQLDQLGEMLARVAAK